MGDYLKSCESDRAMENDIIQLNSSKRRKLYLYRELEKEYHSDIKTAASRSSGRFMYAEPDDVVRIRSLRSPDLKNDLQSENFVEISTSIDTIFSREVFGDSEQLLMDTSSTSEKKTLPAPAASVSMKIAAAKMPTAAELEEFFTAAEKQEQQRFTEKYNYDVVKDIPLEGKYQWVSLHL